MKNGNRTPEGLDLAMPASHRLVDYVIVCGVGDVIEAMDASFGGEIDVAKVPLKPSLLERYPFDDWKDSPLTPSVALFCFPHGAETVRTPPMPSTFTFVVTEGLGTKIYGTSLVFHEPMSQEKLDSAVKISAEMADSELSSPLRERRISGERRGERRSSAIIPTKGLFEPKCLCLLSHYPFYHGFKHYLCELYRISCSEQAIPLERFVSNLFEVPMPPLGRVKIHMSLSNKTLTWWRPPPNALPMADFPLEMLFYALDPDIVLTVFAAVLVERKVIFLSSNYALLTIIIESLLALIFPFHWQGGYVPVLPSPLVDFIAAPVPYIMGANSNVVSPAMLDPEVICVNLDDHTVSQAESVPDLPRKEAVKLTKAIKAFADVFNRDHPTLTNAGDAFQHPPPPDIIDDFNLADIGNESLVADPAQPASGELGFMGDIPQGKFHRRQLRLSFLRFFVALCAKYRKCINRDLLKSTVAVDSCFDKRGFLDDFQKGDKPFVSELVGTQLWSVFISDRLEYHRALLHKESSHANKFVECRFFDECIDAKENRSKLHVYKKGTPFLSNDQYYPKADYSVPAPLVSDIEDNAVFSYPRFPSFNPKLFLHRKAAEMLQEQDVEMKGRAGTMSVTMAALLKGKEYSLFERNSGRDTALMGLLQGELDRYRVELHAMTNKLEERDAELRAAQARLQDHEMEGATLRLELAQMRKRLGELGINGSGAASLQLHKRSASVAVGIGQARGHVQGELDDPPTLQLVQFVHANLSGLESNVLALLKTQADRLAVLQDQVTVLRKAKEEEEEEKEKSAGAKRSMRRRHTDVGMASRRQSSGDEGVSRLPAGARASPKPSTAEVMLVRCKAAARQLLALFPDQKEGEERGWRRLCDEARSHHKMLEAQLNEAMARMAHESSNSPEAAKPDALGNAPRDGGPNLQLYLKCNELAQLIEDLVGALEGLERDPPQTPNWKLVAQLKLRMANSVHAGGDGAAQRVVRSTVKAS